MKKIFTLFACLLLFQGAAQAQNDPETYAGLQLETGLLSRQEQRLPHISQSDTAAVVGEARWLSFSLLNESIAFPFTSYRQFHPGLELGLSLRVVEKDHSFRTINTYAGWFLHQHIESSFFLRAEYLHEFKLGSHFRTGMYGGVGYMHTFYPGPLYEMNPETGTFSEAKQWGRPRALLSAGLQLAWYSEKGWGLWVRQEFAVETPFANGIPLMPHSFVKLGLTKQL